MDGVPVELILDELAFDFVIGLIVGQDSVAVLLTVLKLTLIGVLG